MNIMEKLDLKFENVPNNWAVCFNNDCPLKEQCLRYQAAITVPDGVCYGMSVWPQAYKNGQCRMFAEIKTVTMAWGFSQLYKDLRHEDYKEIRTRMEDHFGRAGNYYRYNRGEKLLTPADQQWIQQLFARYGYTADVVFDHYESRLVFPYTNA